MGVTAVVHRRRSGVLLIVHVAVAALTGQTRGSVLGGGVSVVGE